MLDVTPTLDGGGLYVVSWSPTVEEKGIAVS